MSISIELAGAVAEHYKRVTDLAIEAGDDDSAETLTARATAMRTLTQLIQDIVELEERTKNLHTIGTLEQLLIETIKEYLDEYQYEKFLKDLETRMSKVA